MVPSAGVTLVGVLMVCWWEYKPSHHFFRIAMAVSVWFLNASKCRTSPIWVYLLSYIHMGIYKYAHC